MVMDFKDFCDMLDNGQIAMCSDSELLRYSRSDLQQKEDLVELIGYPDNLLDNWENLIGPLLQVPCCWILHDKDNCDPHIHLIIKWGNNVSMSYFIKYCNQMLKKEGINPNTGKEFCPFKLIQPVKFPEDAYNYLIHDTDKARSEGKYQYSKLERHVENGFDIHFVKQLDTKKKFLISKEISDHIKKYQCQDIMQFYDWICCQGEDFYLVYQSHSGFFDRLCSGNWKAAERKKKKDVPVL